MGVIYFNEVPSDSLNLVVEQFPNYIVPEKLTTSISIPGRSGDLIIDEGKYNNVERTYSIALVDKKRLDNVQKHIDDFNDWIGTSNSYGKLRDTYDPGFFRFAAYKGGTDIENLFGVAGRCDITFDCKPQRYYDYGFDKVIFTKTGTIINPSKQRSRPILIIHGTGTCVLYINGTKIETKPDGFVIINCDTLDCYKDTVNKNSTVNMPNGFPEFISGLNHVILSGGTTKVEVIPRWWRI